MLSVLIDLSPLQGRSISWGVRRYTQELTRALALEQTRGAVAPSALRRVGLLGRHRVSADLRASLAELEDHRQRGLLPRLPRPSSGLLERSARSAAASLIHCLTPESSPRGPGRVPRVVTCHHIDSDRSATEWHGTQSSVALDRRHFLRADRIIAPSRATAQELIARLDIPRSKIEVVYNGVDPALWRAEASPDDGARLAAFSAEPGAYLLCVGTASQRKNVDGMLAALAHARRQLPQAGLRFLWAGEQSRHEEEDARATARRLGVDSAVRFVGRVSDADLGALYRHALALCFVSRREGFGYPMLEAMSCGCPVITSTCSSLGEIAGDAAVTVDPEDPPAIADALVLLAESPGARARLRTLGRERARLFSPERFAEATLAVYRHATQASGR